ncbi:hypothetical protein NEOLEDRAFT_260888 [Neolentinus lepideus HHB14362 ss-1]|uniref:Large ribosomal subunit protein bL28m n=1 Tax=Neolentinus lepideus HHB14362 ss-1 TaxID=1314782 RepID=A0A165T1Y2_9AGAM|nr:hypothetical protein NEOLEDRAFT_260888 [Neolentinus lepideus HHB14362 ss-1]
MLPSIPLLAAIVSQPFKRSQQGLFHGKTRLSGNSIPFSKGKTKRSWLPNVHTKRLFSDALGEKIKLKVTSKALKTVKKFGGLDGYLLHTKSDKLGWEGMRLRLRVEKKLEEKRREAVAVSTSAAPMPSAS